MESNFQSSSTIMEKLIFKYNEDPSLFYALMIANGISLMVTADFLTLTSGQAISAVFRIAVIVQMTIAIVVLAIPLAARNSDDTF